jgi:hypothetical protein
MSSHGTTDQVRLPGDGQVGAQGVQHLGLAVTAVEQRVQRVGGGTGVELVGDTLHHLGGVQHRS